MARRLSRPHRCTGSPAVQVCCMLALVCMLTSGVRSFFGSPTPPKPKATLRDGWDMLAEKAKEVAVEKPTANYYPPTLRDGWRSLANTAKEVAAAKPSGNTPPPGKEPAPAAEPAPKVKAASAGGQGMFKTRVSSELEERLRKEAAFDADGAPVVGDGPNPYLVIFIVIGALTVATYFELGLDKAGTTASVQQQEINQRMYAAM
mmetsp:Transcript_23431/g.54104  ORF Transcript_23431/g.54104 Transcript_23431/m.54104 type:complete len:204 (+) Transcript_23431:94-705(+)